MRARWIALMLVAGCAATALILLQEESESRPSRVRAGAERDKDRRTPGTDSTNVGAAAGANGTDARTAADSASKRQVWYGVAVDRRTGTGEPNARVRIEGHPSGMVWAGGYTLEGGMFVATVPTDVPANDRLRLVVETNDERIGMRGVRMPTLPATGVGTIHLRSRETLSGRCVGPGQVPIGPVALSLFAYGELKPSARPVAYARSDDQGYFDLKNIPRGLYALTGRGPDGELFVRTGVVVPRPRPLMLGARDAKPLQFTILNTAGEPVGHARVVAKLKGPEARRDPLSDHLVLDVAIAQTDADGFGETPPALPGRYDVAVFHLGDRYEFTIDRLQARLLIPTDPRIFVRFVHHDQPLRNARLDTAQGRVTTDADGIAAFARGAPPRFRVQARMERRRLSGQGTLLHRKFQEGHVSLTVIMRRENPEETAPGLTEAGGMHRRVRVIRPDGTPVKDARIFGGPGVVRTDAEGRAEIGKVSEQGSLRLERSDLASGHPSSGALGDLSDVEFHWNAGRRIRIRITDASFGFPVDAGVKISIRSSAWKRVAPGVFEGLWDPEYAQKVEKLTISADGYEPISLVPPYSIGPPIEHEVSFARTGARTDRMVILQVVKRGQGVPGALIYARAVEAHDPGKPGRRTAQALSQDDGVAILRNLHAGRWLIRADGARNGWGQTFAMAGEGATNSRLELSMPPTITGKVVGSDGRGIGGARVSIDDVSRIARTNRSGAFAINRFERLPRHLTLEATKQGYAGTRITWRKKGGVLKKRPLLLHPLRRFAFTLEWQDGGGDPFPADLVCMFGDRVQSELGEGEIAFQVASKGTGTIIQHHGSAVVIGGFRRAWGKAAPLRLLRGARIEGTVKGAGAGVLVSALVWRGRTMVTRTDERGHFVIVGVPPGDVAVDVEGQTPDSRARNAKLKAVDRAVLPVEVER